MLKELQQLQGNLSFKQSHMSKAMRIVGQHIGIGEEHLEGFARRYSLRLRTMCFHTVQGFLKCRGGGQAGSNPYLPMEVWMPQHSQPTSLPPLKEMRMRVGMRMKMIMRMRRKQ
eukprot:5168157-Amphidinium_carterae.1